MTLQYLTEIDEPFGELDQETKIALFAAHTYGHEMQYLVSAQNRWVTDCFPSWNRETVYRLAPRKPSIDWRHVADHLNYLATDCAGRSILYEYEPEAGRFKDGFWDSDGGRNASARAFASFKPGTCEWGDSLVVRPVGTHTKGTQHGV